MMKRFKWSLLLLFVVIFGGITAYASSVKNVTTEGEGVLRFESLGLSDTNIEISNFSFPFREKLIMSFMVNVLDTQTNNNQASFFYEFYDEEGNMTEDENEVKRLQFWIYFTKEDEIVNGVHVDIDSFITNSKADIAKFYPHPIQLNYSFYDDEGNVTEDESEVKEIRVMLDL